MKFKAKYVAFSFFGIIKQKFLQLNHLLINNLIDFFIYSFKIVLLLIGFEIATEAIYTHDLFLIRDLC